ncbi:MAG: hypothetical protein BECKG1743F_GA0114225_111242, partial [Candidatus Kentron sp. G]
HDTRCGSPRYVIRIPSINPESDKSQTEYLLTMGRVVGVIHIQHNYLGRLGVTGNKPVNEG